MCPCLASRVLLWMLLWLVDSLYLEGQRPVYVQSPICVRVCSIDLRRITLVLMHILIQPPSSYKSSFSYKTSDGAETHDPSTHATSGNVFYRVTTHDQVTAHPWAKSIDHIWLTELSSQTVKQPQPFCLYPMASLHSILCFTDPE
jgi:hypothetical protein